MTSTRHQHLASAIAPATREQLAQLAHEHDRMWDRKSRIGAIMFVASLVGVAAAALAIGTHGFYAGSRASQWASVAPDMQSTALALLAILACAIVILWLWWHHVARTHLRSANPYRPIDIRPGELEAQNAQCARALAYLDAIRHQARPIVQHDLEVLATIRQESGASKEDGDEGYV